MSTSNEWIVAGRPSARGPRRLGLDRGDDRVATRGVTATDEHVGAPTDQREVGGFADAAVAPVIRAVVHARSVVMLMRSLFWILEVFTRMSW